MTPTYGDEYGWLTVTDLQLVARARGVNIPADADHDEIVALIIEHDVPRPRVNIRAQALIIGRRVEDGRHLAR